jgi:hypothetical protein
VRQSCPPGAGLADSSATLLPRKSSPYGEAGKKGGKMINIRRVLMLSWIGTMAVVLLALLIVR